MDPPVCRCGLPPEWIQFGNYPTVHSVVFTVYKLVRSVVEP